MIGFRLHYGNASATAPGIVTTGAQTFAGAKTFNNGLKIGSTGTTLTKVLKMAVTMDPASLAANTTTELTFGGLAGLEPEDVILVQRENYTAGVGVVGAYVSAAETLKITFINLTGAPIDMGAQNFYIVAIKG